MSFDVLQSAPAVFDLDNIIHYIAIRLSNPKAARDLLGEYEDRLTNLRDSPRLYGPARAKKLAGMGFHQFNFGNYIAFYKIDDEEQKVYIVRIFYQKQDYLTKITDQSQTPE